MIHNEHFRRADELLEIRHDNNGNAIHVYIKDGQARVFPTLFDFVENVLHFQHHVETFSIPEKLLSKLYANEEYNYYELKRKAAVLIDTTEIVSDLEKEQRPIESERLDDNNGLFVCPESDDNPINNDKDY